MALNDIKGVKENVGGTYDEILLNTSFITVDQTVAQTLGATGARLTKLWAIDIESTNGINGLPLSQNNTDFNIKIGQDAGLNLVLGARYNTFLGYEAGKLDISATNNVDYNTAIGTQSLYSNIEGSFNTCVGAGSLFSNTTGISNTANGVDALALNTTGNYNTAVGMSSLGKNSTGSYNTSIGYNAGKFITNGSTANEVSLNSVYVGYNTKAKIDGGDNEIVIGYDAIGNGSNTATIGNTSLLRTYLTGVNLKLGSTVAGTSPLKFISGALMTAPEIGAIEFLTDAYYATITTGTTRKQFAFTGDVATAHNLLSGVHGDTLADTVVRGDLMYGNATPKWARLAFPATPTGKVLIATATDVEWSANALGTAAWSATGDYIQNQNESAQSANMWINGSIKASDGIIDYGTINNPYFVTFLTAGPASVSSYMQWGNEAINNTCSWLRFVTRSRGGVTVNALALDPDGAATFASTIQATTAKLTNLTPGYVPYHIDDATGLANSGLYYDGTNFGFGTTVPRATLEILSPADGRNVNMIIGDVGAASTNYQIGRQNDVGSTLGFLKFSGQQTGYGGYYFTNIDGTANVVIANNGNVLIGLTTATSGILEIKSGSTSLYPLKLNSAALPTGANILAGGIGFLNDKYYGTTTTGPTIKTFAFEEDTPIISQGTSAPASTPTKVGNIFIDTTGKKMYIAMGTTNSADWEITN